MLIKWSAYPLKRKSKRIDPRKPFNVERKREKSENTAKRSYQFESNRIFSMLIFQGSIQTYFLISIILIIQTLLAKQTLDLESFKETQQIDPTNFFQERKKIIVASMMNREQISIQIKKKKNSTRLLFI